MTAWEQPLDLDVVLLHVHKLAVEKYAKPTDEVQLPLIPLGSSEQELAEHEAKLGRPMPEPIRKMYAKIGGVPLNRDEFVPGVFVVPLSQSEWVDPTDHHALIATIEDAELRREYPGWDRAQYYFFAQTTDGEAIVYCEGPPGVTAGAILHVAYWYFGDTCPFHPLADGLAQWLARWAICDFAEVAIYRVGPWELDERLERAILEDQLRLNPKDEMFRRRLEWIGRQDDIPADGSIGTLVCATCHTNYALTTIFGLCDGFTPGDGAVYSSCPRCGERCTLWPGENSVRVAQDGSAGEEDQIQYVDQPGLRTRIGEEGLTVELPGRSWFFPNL